MARGILQTSPDATPKQELPNIQAPMLDQIRQRTEESVPPELQDGYDAIVNAGLDLLFNKKTHRYMEEFLADFTKRNPQHHALLLAQGIMKLFSVIHQQSQGKMQVEVGSLAAITLLCYVLDFMEKTNRLTVTKSLVDNAIAATVSGFFAWAGITKEQADEAIRQGKPVQPGPDGSVPPPPPAQGGPYPAPQVPRSPRSPMPPIQSLREGR